MPPLIRGHKRIRRLKRGARDFERKVHTLQEHRSHGKGSYLKTHKPPPQRSRMPKGVAAAERGR